MVRVRLLVSALVAVLLASGVPALVAEVAPAVAAPDPVSLAEPDLVRSNGADLAWTAVTVPAGSEFARYEVHRSRTSGFQPAPATRVATLGSRGTTLFADTTASAATAFSYRVVAVVRTGGNEESAASNEIRVTTPAVGKAVHTIRAGEATQLTRRVGSPDACDDARNHGTAPHLLVASEPQRVHRGLVRFDLRRIPAQATVTAARLTMSFDATANRPGPIEVRPLRRAWVEGRGAADGACDGSGASWVEAKGGVPWTAPGGDTSDPVATIPDRDRGTAGVDTVTLTQTVADWVHGRHSNHGVLLRAATEDPTGARAISYASDDSAAPARRPLLVVEYDDATAGPRAPRVVISTPAPDSTVRGNAVRLAAAATDDGRTDRVEFLVDGQPSGVDTTAPYESTFDSTRLPNGRHEITARATDDAGNTGVSPRVVVTVDNTAAPRGAISAPAKDTTVSGPVLITVDARDDVAVTQVEVTVDGRPVGRDTTAPYAVHWRSLDPRTAWADGRHTVAARISDSSGQVVTTDAVEVVLRNGKDDRHGATLTVKDDTPLPNTMAENADPSAPRQDPYATTVAPDTGLSGGSLGQHLAAAPNPATTMRQPSTQDSQGCAPGSYCPTVVITNTGRESWDTANPAQLWYRWYADSGAVLLEGTTDAALPAGLAPGRSAEVPITVQGPKLPPGISSGRYHLRLDLLDAGGTWFSAQGSVPFDAVVGVVCTSCQARLGLEKFWTYEGEPTGAGSVTLTNIANGNMLWRWNPWTAPGRGLASVLDITYNSGEDTTFGLLGTNISYSVSGLTRLTQPLDIFLDLPIIGRPVAVELTDGDGTRHRFDRGSDGNWRRPPGVHLFLRQVTNDRGNPRYWALSRPDNVTFYYDADGFPTAVVDRNGNTITFELEPSPPALLGLGLGYPRKRVTRVVDPGGRAFTFEYTPVLDPLLPILRGKVARITDHDGSALAFDYYDNGNLLRITQRGGSTADGAFLADRSFVFTYTTLLGNEYAIPDPEDRVNPDPHILLQSSRIATIRDPRGNETRYTYFTDNNLLPLKWRLASRENRATGRTTFGYDTDTRTTTVTAPLGRITRYTVDADGKATTIVNPKGEPTRYAWTPDFHVERITEANDAATVFAYNDAGYLTSQRDPLGNTTRLDYELRRLDATDTGTHFALLSKLTQPEGVATPADGDFETTFGYDAVGNPVRQTDPEHHDTTYEWNLAGSPAPGTLRRAIDPRGNPTLMEEYDPNGFATKVTDPEGGVSRASFTADGLLRWSQTPIHERYQGQADERSYRTFVDYDAFHRSGRTSTPKGTAQVRGLLVWNAVEYDANDNVIAVRSPVYGFDDPGTGPLTETALDAMDRPAIVVGPDRHDGEERVEMRYDAAGRVISESTPKGSATTDVDGDYTTTYDYDLLDRVVRVGKRGAPGEPERNAWTCYDNVGNRIADVAPNAGLTSAPPCPVPESVSHVRRFEYDPAHRLVRTVDPIGRTTAMAYNRNGWANTATDAAGKTTTTVFDQRGMVVEKSQAYQGDRRLVGRFVFDANGNMVKEISARAVEKGSTTDYVTEVSYDRLNRPVRLSLPKDGALEAAYEHRGYDADGRLVLTTLPVTSPTLPADLPPSARTELSYFDTGWIASSDEGPNPQVLFDYTAEGWQSQRVPRSTDDDASPPDVGKTMIWSFQPDGQVVARGDEDGQRATYTYDRNNNLLEASVASGVVDPAERAIVTSNAYNGFDELVRSGETKLVDNVPARVENFTTYDYDRDGNLVFRGDEGKAGGQTAAVKRNVFGYDAADQLATQFELGRDPGCAGDRRISTNWTPQGWQDRRVIAVATPACGVEGSGDPAAWEIVQDERRVYADNGNLLELTTRNGAGEVKESHQISYDQDGAYVGDRTRDVVRLIGPDAGKPCAASTCTQTWSFDARNRVTRHEDGHGGTYEFRLDEPGSLADNRVRAGNVTTEVTPRGTLTRSYNGNQLTETRQGGESVKQWYDSLGRLDCVTTGAGTQADCSPASAQVSDRLVTDYAYDYLDRLESVRNYDRRTLKSEALYQNDALDRVVTQVERHIEPNRTQTKRSEFAYLGIANLVAAETRLYEPGAGQPAQRSTKSYSYDTYGRLIRMADDTATQQPGGGFGPAVSTSATFAMDPHASVSLLLGDTGADKGRARASYAYTPYGAEDPTVSTGDTDPVNEYNPYRYTGKRRDTGSGTLDMGSRRYDPSSTRFLQQDIFRGALENLGLATDPLTQNRYALAGGNPTSFIEADGHRVMADGGGSYNPDEGSTPEQAEENKKAREVDREFNGEQAIKEFIGDVTGWNDIRDCITKGDAWACVSVIVGVGLGAIFKAGKIIKGIYRIIDKFLDWKRARSWADGVLEAAESRRAAAVAARQADEAAAAAAKRADEAAAAATKQADEGAQAAKRADEGATARSTKGSTCEVKNSFTPDTPVLMADGTRKPIAGVKEGDLVLAADPETGRVSARPVTALITGDGVKELVEITVEAGGAKGSVVATDAHPFWVAGKHRWIDAKDLRPGDLLRTSSGGYVQVSAVRAWHQPARVHNLTVAGEHTYHVAVATTDVLVHNCGGGGGASRRTTLLGRYQDIKDYMAEHPGGGWDADFLNLRGTMRAKDGQFTKGPGSWNWTRNKRYIDDAIDRGDEIRLVTDPNKPMYAGGNTYARELKYLMGKGYGWDAVGDHWRLTRVRP